METELAGGHEHGTGPAISINRLAARATTRCLTGCAIGEVLGLVIASALGWAVVPSIALAVGLAFVFGYGFTLWPLLSAGWPSRPPSAWRSASTPSRSP